MRVFISVFIFSFFNSLVFSQTEWTGPVITFTKSSFSDWNLEINQDRITDNVWITRANTQGIFNIKTETGYDSFDSPADTEWAFGTIADGVGSLTFADWETTHDSSPPSIVGEDMVLHLITDDIYIDIKFVSWGQGNGDGNGSGGAFSYERSTSTLNVEDIETSHSKLEIYPNPTVDFITIKGAENIKEASIYNASGVLVKEFFNIQNNVIDVQALKEGVYLLQLDSQTIKFTKK